jgi:hypothetical protein
MTIFAADEPPTNTDDFKIWPYVDFSGGRASEAGGAVSTALQEGDDM